MPTNINVLTFDVETTGLNTSVDEIVELCMKRWGEKPLTMRFRPTCPISEEASSVHGMTAEVLKDEPSLFSCLEIIKEWFEWADAIVGYNVKFDTEILVQNLYRIDYNLDLDAKLIVDPYRLWQEARPRKLTDAFKEFCGGNLDNAHEAEADVLATEDVLNRMVEAFVCDGTWDAPPSWEDLANLTNKDRHLWYGTSNHFIKHPKTGEAVLNFGKHKGQLASESEGYLGWMLTSSFAPSVKKTVREILKVNQ